MLLTVVSWLIALCLIAMGPLAYHERDVADPSAIGASICGAVLVILLLRSHAY